LILLLRIGSVISYCEDNEPSVSIRHGDFFDIAEQLLASQKIPHYMGSIKKR
jgi:hypothetical protein